MESAIRQKNKLTTYILNITEDDKSVFKKIIVLSCVSALLGVVILILFVTFLATHQNKPEHVMAAICVSFSLELFACIIIHIVFTTQIKVKTKERLKFVSNLGMMKSGLETIITYPKTLRSIGEKLHKYFS